MLNRDFLKAIFRGSKKLLKQQEVKKIVVPRYDELSVKNIFPMVKDDPEIMIYLPATLPKGKLPERTYFFNVFNTVHHERLVKIIEHANKQRFASMDPDMVEDTIEVSNHWWEELNRLPFFSRKSLYIY